MTPDSPAESYAAAPSVAVAAVEELAVETGDDGEVKRGPEMSSGPAIAFTRQFIGHCRRL